MPKDRRTSLPLAEDEDWCVHEARANSAEYRESGAGRTRGSERLFFDDNIVLSYYKNFRTEITKLATSEAEAPRKNRAWMGSRLLATQHEWPLTKSALARRQWMGSRLLTARIGGHSWKVLGKRSVTKMIALSQLTLRRREHTIATIRTVSPR